MTKHLYGAIATMVGTIIGAGVLGLPYVIAQAGFLTGLFLIIALALIVYVVYLYMGEVALRTKGRHQLTGYAEIYLGKWGKRLMLMSMLLTVYGALTAYIIGEGASFQALFGGNVLMWQAIFVVGMGLILFFGLRALEKSEMIFSFIVLVIVVLISFLAMPEVKLANLTEFNPWALFVPYGVVLFAFLGLPAIPEIREELEGQEKYMKKALFYGMLIPAVVYIVFSFAVVGVVGLSGFEQLPEKVATIALGNAVGPYMIAIGNLFAIFAMATSFLALGFALLEMYQYDYGMKKGSSLALTLIVPIIIVLSGWTNFIQVIAISGVFAGGMEGILVVLMFWKAKKRGQRKPEFVIPRFTILGLFIMLVYVSGAALQLFG